MAEMIRPGAIANWEHRDAGPGTATIVRPVKVWQMLTGGRAIVAFGLRGDGNPNLFEVPAEELVSPSPPANLLPVVPLPIDPPSMEPTLEARREALAQAHNRFHEARSASSRAQVTADLALNAVTRAHQKLRSFVDAEAEAVYEAITSLRQNRLTDPMQSARWVGSEQAKNDAAIAEKAYQTLAQELAHCRERERDCYDLVNKTAADLTGALLSEEILKLHQIETAAADLRTRLKSCAEFWPEAVEGPPRPLPLSAPAQIIISNDPAPTLDPVGPDIREKLRQERQQPIQTLFFRLVDGDVDADIQQ